MGVAGAGGGLHIICAREFRNSHMPSHPFCFCRARTRHTMCGGNGRLPDHPAESVVHRQNRSVSGLDEGEGADDADGSLVK